MIKYFTDINASAGGGAESDVEEIEELEIPEQFVFMLAKIDLNRGGIFTIRTEAGLFIKRIQQRMDGKIDVISDNSVYPIQVLDPHEVEVVGRVVSRFGDVD